MNLPFPKRSLWLLIPLLLVALLVMYGCVETIPPRDLTVTRIRVTEGRLRAYWGANGALPAHLSDLPRTPGRDDSTVDGWGRDISYQRSGASAVTLSSLGADGAPGGVDLDKDIVVSFDAARNP